MFKGLEVLDTVRLNFSTDSLLLLNFTLAFIMFGVALELKLGRFKHILQFPKATIVGVASQFIVMPLLTLLLVLIINPTPGVAMGMILVAACPGGNVSNFMTSNAKGNTELSVSLTAIADLSAIIMTPLNFAFWGGIYANFYNKATHLIMPVNIDGWEMVKTMILLLGIPLIVGMLFSNYFPKITRHIIKPIKITSLIIFAGYVIVALAANFNYIIKYINLVFIIVLLHNAIAFIAGYTMAKSFKLKNIDVRTVTIETGIQNSGLALVLIFNPNLFNGLGGMAYIAALWGIWHIISGVIISAIWSYKPVLKFKSTIN